MRMADVQEWGWACTVHEQVEFTHYLVRCLTNQNLFSSHASFFTCQENRLCQPRYFYTLSAKKTMGSRLEIN